MPSIRFRSLRSRAYSVSVSQRSATAELSPALPPDLEGALPGTLEKIGTVTIEANGPIEDGYPVATAPGGIFFTAKAEGFVSSDPDWAAWKDLNYRWSFDDPGWYTRHDTDDLPWGRYYDVDGKIVLIDDGRVPRGTSVRFLGNDRNVAYGPWVCHVFAPEATAFERKPEKLFRVRCEVRAEPTEEPLLIVERDVKLRNPDSVFARGRTILISEKGDTSNPSDPLWETDKYPGATLANSHTEAILAAKAGPLSSGTIAPLRFLFRRGETPELAPAPGAAGNGSQGQKAFYEYVERLFYGSYGDPEDPPPTPTGTWNLLFGQRSAANDTEFAIWGLDYHGPYDPSQPDAVARPPDGITVYAGARKTVWDMSIRGWQTCLNGETNATVKWGRGFTNLIVGNTFISDWADFGIFVHGGKTMVGETSGPRYHGQCGVWIKQTLATVMGPGKNEVGPPVYADHGPFRCNAPGSPSAFNLVSYRSLNDWSGVIQPCNRWGGWPIDGTSPSFEGALHFNWDRAVFDGGRGITADASYQSEGIPAETPALPVKGLFDKIYSVMYVANGRPIDIRISGPVMRNCITVYPDQPTMGSNQIGDSFYGRTSTPTPGVNANTTTSPVYYHESTLDYGIELYSSTLIDLRSYSLHGKPMILPGVENAWKYFVNANNVLHAPDRPDITTTDGPLDDTVLWTVQFDGLRYKGDPLQEIYAISRDTAQRFAPLRGSPAYHGAEIGPDKKIAVDDFYGRVRVGAPSRGAVEAD